MARFRLKRIEVEAEPMHKGEFWRVFKIENGTEYFIKTMTKDFFLENFEPADMEADELLNGTIQATDRGK